MVERSSVRSIVSSREMSWPARLVPMFLTVLRQQPHSVRLSKKKRRRSTLAPEASFLLRVAVDDRAEQLPFLVGEPHHLHLFDRIEIRRRGLDADSRDIGVDLEIQVGDHLHDVGAGNRTAAAPSWCSCISGSRRYS